VERLEARETYIQRGSTRSWAKSMTLATKVDILTTKHHGRYGNRRHILLLPHATEDLPRHRGLLRPSTGEIPLGMTTLRMVYSL
jgi:hypothetical protein